MDGLDRGGNRAADDGRVGRADLPGVVDELAVQVAQVTGGLQEFPLRRR